MNKKVKVFYYLNDLNTSLKKIKCYLFEETILLIAECECEVKYFFIDDFNSNYFDTFRNLAVQFVIELKYLRELKEKRFDKNNIVIEKKYHKLKEFIKNDIGDSIIIVENKYKELNMKDKLGLVFISDTELSNTNKSN